MFYYTSTFLRHAARIVNSLSNDISYNKVEVSIHELDKGLLSNELLPTHTWFFKYSTKTLRANRKLTYYILVQIIGIYYLDYT